MIAILSLMYSLLYVKAKFDRFTRHYVNYYYYFLKKWQYYNHSNSSPLPIYLGIQRTIQSESLLSHLLQVLVFFSQSLFLSAG